MDPRDEKTSSESWDYIDFELEIGASQGREYPVAVIRSPGGEARETMQWPFSDLMLENRLKDLRIALLRSSVRSRRVASPEEYTVQAFGRELLTTLFTGEIRSRFEVSRSEARRQGKRLRLKLRIQAPELAALPWEYLYDPRQDEYLCLSRSVSLVRYLELPDPPQPLAVEQPLRILGVIASPSDLPILDVRREQQRLEQAIEPLRNKKIELSWLQGQTWRDIQQALRRGSWHIFHFIGHGTFDELRQEGSLALANEAGKTYALSATQLGRLLADHASLRLVLLNACEGAEGNAQDLFSSTAATLVRRGIPAVLAMQYEITDRAAIEFSRGFYEAIADDLPVDAAVSEARIAMSLAGVESLEWGTPVLHMRSPDGRLFETAPVLRTKPTEASGTGSAGGVDSEKREENEDQRIATQYAQAMAELDAGQWEPALLILEDIVTQRPDFQDARRKLEELQRRQQVENLYDEAKKAFDARSWTVALEDLAAIQKLTPGFRDVAALAAEATRQKMLADLYVEARRRAEAQDWEAVLTTFERMAELDTAVPDPEHLLPVAHAKVNEQRHREREEKELEDLYERAVRETRQGRWSDAVTLWEELERRAPEYRDTAAQLAQARDELRRADEASSVAGAPDVLDETPLASEAVAVSAPDVTPDESSPEELAPESVAPPAEPASTAEAESVTTVESLVAGARRQRDGSAAASLLSRLANAPPFPLTRVFSVRLAGNTAGWKRPLALGTAIVIVAVLASLGLAKLAGTGAGAGSAFGLTVGGTPIPYEATPKWTRVAHLLTPVQSTAAVTGPDGRIYVIDGVNTNPSPASLYLNVVEAYTPATNSWTQLTPTPTSRGYLAAAVGSDGRIYAIGGSGSNGALATVEVYTSSTNSWATVAPLPAPRQSLSAVEGSDGRIYAMGGYDNNFHYISEVDAYSPSTNTWVQVAPLPSGVLVDAVAAGSDGRIYVICTFCSGQDGVEAYAPATDTWTAIAEVPTNVYRTFSIAAAAGSDGRIYVIGGYHFGSNNNGHLSATVDAFSPATSSWTQVASLETPRSDLVATVGPDGRIYAIDGRDDQANTLDIVESYQTSKT